MEVASPAARPHPVPRECVETPGQEPLPSEPSLARLLLLVLPGSLLYFLAFFPADLGFLGWLALVPLLTLVRCPARPWKVYLAAWLAGLVFYLAALSWMTVANVWMVYAWAALAPYCALYFLLAVFLTRVLDRHTGLSLVLSFPLVWTALEWLRSTFGGGFSWYLLGYTQHAFLPLIQIADLGGVWLVSFLVAAVNALLFEWVWRSEWLRGREKDTPSPLTSNSTPQRAGRKKAVLVGFSALLLALFAGALAYGAWRLGQDDFAPGPRLALIQGNVEQDVRNDRISPDEAKRKIAISEMEEHYHTLTEYSLRWKPELIIWPETSWPTEYEEVAPEVARGRKTESQLRVRDETRKAGTYLLYGMNYRYYHSDDVPPEKYNTALLVAPNGQVAGHYHKMHLLPFGEFIPFAEVFPWMVRLTPYDATYSCVPGKEATRLAVGRHRFGVVICYEDADPPLARQYVDPAAGPRADFLVNISNDGWFKGSCEHEQHLAICRFRAIECRRSVVRSVNMGISGVIDANGRVLAPRQVEHRPDDSRIWDISWDDRKQELPVHRWGEFKKVSGVLLAVVPLDQRSTLYASWGEWVPLGCWVALGLLLVLALIRRWRPGEGVSTS